MQAARQSARADARVPPCESPCSPPDIAMWELIALLALGFSGWFVWDSLRAREAANSAIRAACTAEGLLFLDDTVALASLRAVRDADGRLRLRRVYGFEYSDTGNNRCKASVTLVGQAVGAIEIGVRSAPDAATLH